MGELAELQRWVVYPAIMCLRRKEKFYYKILLEAPQDLPCHELLLVTYKRLVVLTDPLQTSSLKRLVLDQLLSMTATGGNTPKTDQKSGRRQDPRFQWHARFHTGILYIPSRWWISLDPYKTLCSRGLILESLTSSQACSNSHLLILQLNTVLGFPPTNLCSEYSAPPSFCMQPGWESFKLSPPSLSALLELS